MKVLLIYPKYPDSFWSFKHALRFISKKAAVPPLGLITVSAMLPSNWQKKLIDMNVSNLKTANILWADYVFISAMHIQRDSVDKIISMCIKYGVKTVAGGPLFTQEPDCYPMVDHLILNEAEITMPQFLKDLENGNPKKVYKSNEFPAITQTPVPDFNLLKRNKYAFMNIQVSRGCPFSCEFCEITALFGHKVRLKSTIQILKELDNLYALKWRGNVFIVDDNFIGNKEVIKHELLPAIESWMQLHKFPFTFNTEVSINIADDEVLLRLMVRCGFSSVFIGIESPEENSLQECNKVQNKNRDLLQCIKKIQKEGLLVSGGFIVGFDNDSSLIFQKQIDFIQQSGIVSAMVGLLNAPKNTKLYQRLIAEKRIINKPSGNNTDYSINFVPKMNYQELISGYKKVIHDIYTPKPYYKRIRAMSKNYKPIKIKPVRINISKLIAFLKSIFIIGLVNNGRWQYWKLLLWTIFKKPALLSCVIEYTIYGYHYRTIFGLHNKKRSN